MTITAQTILVMGAPADAVFAVLANWGGICDWAPPEAIRACRVEGDIRYLTSGQGHEIAERLDGADRDRHQIRFSIVGPGPGRVENYHATVRVEPIGLGRAQVTWTGTMEPPEGADPARIKAGFEASYRMLIESAARAARGEIPGGPASTAQP